MMCMLGWSDVASKHYLTVLAGALRAVQTLPDLTYTRADGISLLSTCFSRRRVRGTPGAADRPGRVNVVWCTPG